MNFRWRDIYKAGEATDYYVKNKEFEPILLEARDLIMQSLALITSEQMSTQDKLYHAQKLMDFNIKHAAKWPED